MKRNNLLRPFVALLLSSTFMIPISTFGHGPGAASAVSGPGYWGLSETFWNVSTGTDPPASINGLSLMPYTSTDSVVLDGFLYLMTKANMIGTVATYSPPNPPARTNDWNLSVEVTRPREGSAYESPNITAAAGQQALMVYVTNASGDVLSGVRLVTGDPITEAIFSYNATTSSWEQTANDLRPAFPHRSDAFGLKPDRYILAFAHADLSPQIRVSVTNTASGVVFVRDVNIPTMVGVEEPRLRFDMDVNTGKVSKYNVASGWMLDNLVFRSMLSRYPVVGPTYEAVSESDPLWIQVHDDLGASVADASVVINGTAATYNAENQRYEAFVPRAVDWDVPITFSVVADGVAFGETLRVTTILDGVSRISLPKWWNGWDWVTVFGRDDSASTMSAQTTFIDFDHPKTNYISSSFLGNSTDLLATQSEIAIHYPHDYVYWGFKTWDEAVDSSVWSGDMFNSTYWFASRWDDPRYVGKGDSYISIACPGNSASWEEMYAQFSRGARIMGISAQYYLGGNSSLVGSYWLHGPSLTSIPDWASWDPHARMDMMDMFRAINTDNVVPDQYEIVRTVAEAGGVLRLYNHGTVAAPAFLRWLSDPKTNLSYENWKATDGEVASYVYGRASVDVSHSVASTPDKWVYNVTRRDPFASGYWRVPVTVALDITDKKIDEITVSSGGKVQRMSDGSLRGLNGSRTMDVGYDIRGHTLYVSHFWNESATLTVTAYGLFNPRFTDEPKTSGIAYQDFRTRINATEPDNGTSVWSLLSAPGWLSILESNETSCLLGGLPTEPGVYDVRLSVSDSNTTSVLNWSIEISKLKTVSGHIKDQLGAPLGDQIVMVAFKTGGDIRTVEYASTDQQGYYTLLFAQGDWAPGDRIEVSSSLDTVTKVNATVADNLPHQEIDISFRGQNNDTASLAVAGTVAGAASAAVVAAVLWRRRKKSDPIASATSGHP